MKQKLLEIIQVTVWLHAKEFIFVWFYKNENGRQNYYFDGRAPQLSAGNTGRRHDRLYVHLKTLYEQIKEQIYLSFWFWRWSLPLYFL